MGVQQRPHGALHPAHLAQLLGELRRRGNEPVGLSPREPAPARRERGHLLSRRAAPARGGPRRGIPGRARRDRGDMGRRDRGPRLRPASAPRRVRGVGHRAARRAERLLLPHRGARLSPRRRAGRSPRATLARRLDAAVRRGAPVQGLDHGPARGAGRARRLPAQPRRLRVAAARGREGRVLDDRGGGRGRRARRAQGVRAPDHELRRVRARRAGRDGGLQPVVLPRGLGVAGAAVAHVRAAGHGASARVALRWAPRSGVLAVTILLWLLRAPVARRAGRVGLLRPDDPAGQRRGPLRVPARARPLQLSLGAGLRACSGAERSAGCSGPAAPGG